ncbi:DUF885 domain-containing protein [Xanthovirga aplysinae]|uniref:DUF885 domain-containing protein n=1 Tax=Xanthovirga aplysinae TaxID=2529853 RepID=UPI0012BD2DD3|nr:DUF885 domain-containing protein [Xanthovirga aplysinae]MTI33075.1 DUF885 domain-containing protein [Xanthovirga aplysinae]
MIKKRLFIIPFLCLFCLPAIVFSQTSETEKFYQLIEKEWAFRLKSAPEWAVSLGHTEYKGQKSEVSIGEEKRQAKYLEGILNELKTIDRTKLSKKDRINYEVFYFLVDNRVQESSFEPFLIPISADGGFHINFVYMAGGHPFDNVEHFEQYIGKLQDIKEKTQSNISLMRTGIQKGITLPAAILVDYEKKSVDPHIVDDPTKSYFYKPFLDMPSSISESKKKELRQKGVQGIRESVIPAYQSFSSFLKKEYRPSARKTLGASALPNGKAYYEQQVKFYTTLDLPSDEIFEIGQKEVKRIRAEMEAIIEEVGFKGSFTHFLEFLRTDPQFYCDTPECLLKEATFLAKTIDSKLPQLFNKLPRLPYGVEAVPDEIAPNYTAGRYVGGSSKENRAGFYWVNTYKLDSRPLYILPALTLHEAVPGHHLQKALAEELEDLPEFRKYTYLSSFGEGWALYSESLGKEVGLYRTPYEHFGRLTYEMWRACRLVVDVGLHAKNWTREEAVNFMKENTALSLHEIGTEVDRYIAWPAQALSYKMGELKIKELRQKAESELKEDFDIREFHDVVLANGAIPLFVLEEVINDWLASKGV